jgi:hypothetical protein
MRWIGNSYTFEDCLSQNIYDAYFVGGHFSGGVAFTRSYTDYSLFSLTLDKFELRNRLDSEAIPISGFVSFKELDDTTYESEVHLFTTSSDSRKNTRTDRHHPLPRSVGWRFLSGWLRLVQTGHFRHTPLRDRWNRIHVCASFEFQVGNAAPEIAGQGRA